jgi:predicted acetyltransferase
VSEPERLTAADQDAFEAACHLAFHEIAHPDDIAMDKRVTEPERTVGVREGGDIVATGAILTRELSIPGGTLPVAGVSAIGVVPGHTRRGHLGRIMRMLLDDAREAGETVAALWASEGAIYGRYGFGPATRAMRYELELDRVALRRDAALPEALPEVGVPADALERIRPVFDRVRAGRPGMLDRPGAWWDRRIHDPEHRRDGAGPLRAALQPGPDGEVAGYALFAAKMSWDDRGPAGSVMVKEVVAETPEAHGGLWRFLLGLDLVRTLQWRLAPEHDALAHLLDSNDAVNRRAGDGLFVRLLDVDAALSARSYATPVDLVLELDDPFCPWNSGRHRLREDRCEPTDAPADLALGAEALGAVYLGGTPLTAFAAAGRVRELRPGALAEAATAFRGAVEPWCPEIF